MSKSSFSEQPLPSSLTFLQERELHISTAIEWLVFALRKRGCSETGTATMIRLIRSGYNQEKSRFFHKLCHALIQISSPEIREHIMQNRSPDQVEDANLIMPPRVQALFIAQAFHDLVYMSEIEKDFPQEMREILGLTLSPTALSSLVHKTVHTINQSLTLLTNPSIAGTSITYGTFVQSVFGYDNSRILSHHSPYPGFNEYISALITVASLADTVSIDDLLLITHTIAMSIPFMATNYPHSLAQCLRQTIDLPGIADLLKVPLGTENFQDKKEKFINLCVTLACTMSNRDVEDFGQKDYRAIHETIWQVLHEDGLLSHHPTVSDLLAKTGKFAFIYGTILLGIVEQIYYTYKNRNLFEYEVFTDKARINLAKANIELNAIAATHLLIALKGNAGNAIADDIALAFLPTVSALYSSRSPACTDVFKYMQADSAPSHQLAAYVLALYGSENLKKLHDYYVESGRLLTGEARTHAALQKAETLGLTELMQIFTPPLRIQSPHTEKHCNHAVQK